MTQIIPSGGKWFQGNRSDVLGNIQGTFNVDFTTNLEKTRVNRTLTTTSGLDGLPVGFKSTGALIYAVAGSKVYVGSALKTNTAFTADVTANTPLDCDAGSDIEIFLSGIAVAANSKLYYYNGSWANNALGMSGPYSMCVYANTLYIAGVGGVIKKTTDGTTIASGITLGSVDQGVSWIRAARNRIWIGTINVRNGKGQVLEWDGVSTQVTATYRLESQGTMSAVILNDIPYITDTNGRLLAFSGGTFVELARFPLYNKILQGADTSVTFGDKPIHKNGMTISNGLVNILMRNTLSDSASSLPEFCPSGIWEYTKDIGLYHKYSLSYTPVGTNTITDYGQNRISVPGALTEMKIGDTSVSATGNLIAGATVYTDASATTSCTFTNDTFDAVSGTTGQYATQAWGYIVTTKIHAKSLMDSWSKIYALHEKFLTASDKIVIKYRNTSISPIQATITWTSTNSFSTATNVSAYVIGDEVEITQGTGGGLCAHITNIQTGAGPTYIVTLDEIFTGATGSAMARFQKWTKSGLSVQDVLTIDQVPIENQGTWIQMKICMLFTGKNELKELALINSNYKSYS